MAELCRASGHTLLLTPAVGHASALCQDCSHQGMMEIKHFLQSEQNNPPSTLQFMLHNAIRERRIGIK